MPQQQHLPDTKKVLFTIVVAQFACTSLWFAGNVALVDLTRSLALPASLIGNLASAVQFGFIAGTLSFALLNLADRYSPSKIFLICAIAGATANLAILWTDDFRVLIFLRAATGFCLAGIYPIGMKIAADYHQKGLGKALGYLVGALVLGTAFPHLLRGLTGDLRWEVIILSTSALALFGGLLLFLMVPDGPYRTKSGKINLSTSFTVFRNADLRSAAFGYFGHMWELYSFWAFLPLILNTYNALHSTSLVDIPLTAFLIICAGAVGCVSGGYLASSWGSFNTARLALTTSMVCCLASPFIFQLPLVPFLSILTLWSVSVVADSPQFSTLVAGSASAESKGTALTIVNCIGFFITILSIQFVSYLAGRFSDEHAYLILAIGPLLGISAMRRSRKERRS